MRPNYDHGITSEGTHQATKVRMGLEETALAHIISVLTNLYADPEAAVIREYATNAFDSHVEARQTRPVEVSLPNSFSPIFVVQDYGVGMSREELEYVYSRYGASTKRDSDEVNGMLGLGAKSALAYTNAFTVVSVQDGKMNMVVVARDEDGGASLNISDEVDTDKPNGVRVEVAVSNIYSFNQKAKDFFKYWEPGKVLVDGEQPEPEGEAIVLDPDVTYYKTNSRGYHDDVIVMGNVAYPLSGYNNVITSSYGSEYAVVRVPIGAVTPTPSREGLIYNAHTKEVIETARAFVKEHLARRVQETFDACETHADALKLSTKNYGQFTYRGEPIPRQVPTRGFRFNLHGGRRSASRIDGGRVSTSDLVGESVAVVTGFGLQGLTATHREKVRIALEEAGVEGVRTVFFLSTELAEPWYDNVTKLAWEDVKAIKVERPKSAGTGGGGRRVAGTAEVLVTSGFSGYWQTTELADLEEDGKYALVGTRQDINQGRLSLALPGWTIVRLGLNRFDKFRREFPNALPYREAVEAQFKDVRAEYSDFDLALNFSLPQPLRQLGSYLSQVEDPEVREVIRTFNKGKEGRNQISNLRSEVWNLPRIEDEKVTEKVETFKTRTMRLVKDTYPLLASLTHGTPDPDALLEYVNTLYAVRQREAEEAAEELVSA